MAAGHRVLGRSLLLTPAKLSLMHQIGTRMRSIGLIGVKLGPWAIQTFTLPLLELGLDLWRPSE